MPNSVTCPGGEIGRRRGLKIPRRKVCRFESDPGYHIIKQPIQGCFFISKIPSKQAVSACITTQSKDF